MINYHEKFKEFTQDQLDEAIVEACIAGQIEEIKYLLNLPDLKIHNNLDNAFNESFSYACVNDHLQVVKYLLNEPKLQKHITNENILDGFQSACFYQNMSIVNYLISEFNLELTNEIKSFLNYPNEQWTPINIFQLHKDTFKEIQVMFDARELNKQLSITIGSKDKRMKL